MLPRASGTALVLPVLLPVLLAALLTVSGCGKKDTSPTSAPLTAPSTTPAAPATTPTAPATTASATPTANGSPTSTCTESAALADGSWNGPITMVVDGKGGNAPFTSSPGRGALSLVVANGKVTSGTWTVRWTSHGHAESGNASADIDVVGTIKGTAAGSASAPALSGTWNIKGKATITEPEQMSAPIDESGPNTEPLKLQHSSGCGTRIQGRFAPSFTSKDAAATFHGKAVWEGTRS